MGASFFPAVISPAAGASQPDLVEGFAEGNGVRQFFVRGGEGELMLFLHGLPDNWTVYRSQLAEFSRDHLVVAPNLRGFPPSVQPDAVEAYAMPRSLDDLHALLRHFGRERCILVGHDWGGYIAWVFASAYPRHVERLIILNAPHPAMFLREVRNNATQIQALQYERDYNTATAPYPSWYNYYRADPIKVPASIAGVAGRKCLTSPGHSLPTSLSVPPRRRSGWIFRRWGLWGMQDRDLLPGMLDGLPDYAPKATVVRIEDAGHSRCSRIRYW